MVYQGRKVSVNDTRPVEDEYEALTLIVDTPIFETPCTIFYFYHVDCHWSTEWKHEHDERT